MALERADYTKKERAELRRLASVAYDRELDGLLAELERSFSAWRQGNLLNIELSEEIREFHQHAARGIWSAHQVLDVPSLVARALALGILTEEEVPPALREKLTSSVAPFSEGDDS